MSGIEQVRHTRLASLAASKSVDLIRILDGPKRRSPWLPIGWCGYFPSHGAFLFSSLTRSITLRQAVRRSPTGRDPGRPRLFLVTCPHANNNPVINTDPTGHECFDTGDIPSPHCTPDSDYEDGGGGGFGDNSGTSADGSAIANAGDSSSGDAPATTAQLDTQENQMPSSGPHIR